jgi:hypothetical protein
VLLFYPTFVACAADKKPSVEKKAPQHGYDYEHPALQPLTENLDLAMYSRIREEGLNHSRIMEYASGLFDGIGQAPDWFAQYGKSECLDAPSTYRHGLLECASGKLGRIRHGMAADRHLRRPGLA